LRVGAIGAWRAILYRSVQFRKYERVVQDFPGAHMMALIRSNLR
jgi:hypothetical protein